MVILAWNVNYLNLVLRVEDCSIPGVLRSVKSPTFGIPYTGVHGIRSPIIFGVYSKLGRYAEGARESESGRDRHWQLRVSGSHTHDDPP